MAKIKARSKKDSNNTGVHLHPPKGEVLVKHPCCKFGDPLRFKLHIRAKITKHG